MFAWEQWHLLAEKWAAFMGIRILESALVLLLTGLIWAAFRKRLPAQTGYWLFLLVLFKLIIPGPVTIKGGAWGDYFLKMNKISASSQNRQAEAHPAALEAPEITPLAGQITGRKPPESTPSSNSAAASKSPNQILNSNPNSRPPLLSVLMLTWLASVILMLAKLTFNQIRLRRLIRRSQPVELAHLPVSFNELQSIAGIRKPVSVFFSKELASPAVLGIFRPLLILPRDLFTQYTPSQIKWILLHEMAHIRRFDNLVFLFQKLVQMLFFLYPGVWIANRIIDRQREYACDDAALEGSLSSRRECGLAFINLVTDSCGPSVLRSGPCSGIHSCRHNIRGRLKRILDGSRPIKARLSRGGLAFTLAAIILIGLFSLGSNNPGFSLTSEEPESPIILFHSDQTPPQSMVIPIPGLPEDAVKLEMVLIKAGTFVMGTPEAETGKKNISWPAHKVTISRDFYMGKFEVTQAQWEAVAGKHRSYFRGRPNHPVERVSWRAVRKFLKQINALGLGTFRLPTEAEWEYACRAGTQTRFSFGESYDRANSYMWWAANNQPHGTKQVGLKLPNPWGLYDMHGNVSEWCSDFWGKVSMQGNRTDPQGPKKGSSLIPFLRKRIFRGGGYFYPLEECSSAYRSFEQEVDYHASVGFRLVLEISERLPSTQAEY